jgi:hypothetical protein
MELFFEVRSHVRTLLKTPGLRQMMQAGTEIRDKPIAALTPGRKGSQSLPMEQG